MNAGQYINSLLNPTSNVHYKNEIQPNNVSYCTTYKAQLTIPPCTSWKRFQTKITNTPTALCEQNKYKEIILPKNTQTATNEYTNTLTPTTICQSDSYKTIFRRIKCNTMS